MKEHTRGNKRVKFLHPIKVKLLSAHSTMIEGRKEGRKKKDMMFYRSFRVKILKHKPMVESQEIKRRESKYTTTENHQFTKEDSRRGTKKLQNIQTIGGKSRSLPINNY